MRLLVTNDDGVDAPGLHELAGRCTAAGHDLVVAAPLDDRSGSGAAIGRLHVDDHIDVERREIDGLEGVRCSGSTGHRRCVCWLPGSAGSASRRSMVVSGINPGCNTGPSRPAFGHGRRRAHGGELRGVRPSPSASTPAPSGFMQANRQRSDEPAPWSSTQPGRNWRTAADVAVGRGRLAGRSRHHAPSEHQRARRGVRRGQGRRLGHLASLGTVRSAVVESTDGRLQMELRASGAELPADSDTGLVQAGYVAVTVIKGIAAVARRDIAEHLDAFVATCAESGV